MTGPEERNPGDRAAPGHVKRALLLHIFSTTEQEGIKPETLKDLLQNDWPRISDPDGIKNHLNNLSRKKIVIRKMLTHERKGLEFCESPYRWKPIEDIQHFREVWLDKDKEIFMGHDTQVLRRFLRSLHVKQIIQDSIVPAFIRSDVTETFHFNNVYMRLPRKSASREDEQELEEIYSWAFQNSPLLITHVFRPVYEVDNYVIKSLEKQLFSQRSGNVDKIKRLKILNNRGFQDFQPVPELSKEVYGLLTAFACLSIDLIRNPENPLRSELMEDKDQDWFKKMLSCLSSRLAKLDQTNNEIIVNLVELIFMKRFLGYFSIIDKSLTINGSSSDIGGRTRIDYWPEFSSIGRCFGPKEFSKKINVEKNQLEPYSIITEDGPDDKIIRMRINNWLDLLQTCLYSDSLE